MKTFVCQVCGHVAFGTAPDNCPICGAPKEQFKETADAIKRAVDPANMTDAEKKHTPVIKITGNSVAVTVGEIIHPMTVEHHIMYVDFYIDNCGIRRIPLGPSPAMPNSPLMSEPKASTELNFKPGQEVKVLSNCNLHGRWVAAQKV